MNSPPSAIVVTRETPRCSEFFHATTADLGAFSLGYLRVVGLAVIRAFPRRGLAWTISSATDPIARGLPAPLKQLPLPCLLRPSRYALPLSPALAPAAC